MSPCLLLAAFLLRPAAGDDGSALEIRTTPAAPPSTALGVPATGPVIDEFGAVYPVPDGAYGLDPAKVYKGVMDVAGTGAFIMALNPAFESASKFLNLQGRTGSGPDQIEFALIVHGEAAKDVLTDRAYRDRFGVLNPNTRIVGRLHDAGVRIFVCGQTAMRMGYRQSEINPAVSMAVSAMTAHVRLQSEGFILIPLEQARVP